MKITIETFDEAKRSIIINPQKGATKMNHKKETGAPIFFDIILDASGSMEKYFDILVQCVNSILIPALVNVSERQKNALRLGCLLFSKELIPAWIGFKTLEELGSRPLRREMFNKPGLGGSTTLYGAMKSAIIWTAASIEHMRETGRGEVPKGKIIVLTDGANNNPPENGTSVNDSFNGLDEKAKRAFSNKGKNQKVIGYFNTDNGLNKEQFETMAKVTGFEAKGFYDIAKGKTLEEKQKAFRHHFEMFSRAATDM